MNAFKPNSIPTREAIVRERARRANRRRAQWLSKLARPDWPAWPLEADCDPKTWMAQHWSERALEDYEIFTRGNYFRTMDTVMGALALAVWEAGPDYGEVTRLLQSVGLPVWPAGTGGQALRDFLCEQWGPHEFGYFRRWSKWAPLEPDQRREAHAERWRQSRESEARQARSLGRCWWRTCCDPNPNAVCAHVDIAAGLRLAIERGHDQAYPRPDEVEADEE